MRSRLIASLFLAALLLPAAVLDAATGAAPGNANAGCRGRFITFSDFALSGMGPLRFSGMALTPEDPNLPDFDSGGLEFPMCSCPEKTGSYWGLVFSYWEIHSLIVTRSNAMCDPATGTDYNVFDPGVLNGASDQNPAAPHTFTQWQLSRFPFNAVFGIAADIKCMQQTGVDYEPLLFSEIIPEEQDDLWEAVRYPVSFLGAFPFADLACAPATIATLTRHSPKYFPFCAWGLIFPLNGSKASPDRLEANAANAAKVVAKGALDGVVLDNVSNYCKGQIRPVWNPAHFRLAAMRPFKSRPFLINEPSALWGSGKGSVLGNDKNGPDDFLFTLFQKKRCCEKAKGAPGN